MLSLGDMGRLNPCLGSGAKDYSCSFNTGLKNPANIAVDWCFTIRQTGQFVTQYSRCWIYIWDHFSFLLCVWTKQSLNLKLWLGWNAGQEVSLRGCRSSEVSADFQKSTTPEDMHFVTTLLWDQDTIIRL